MRGWALPGDHPVALLEQDARLQRARKVAREADPQVGLLALERLDRRIATHAPELQRQAGRDAAHGLDRPRQQRHLEVERDDAQRALHRGRIEGRRIGEHGAGALQHALGRSRELDGARGRLDPVRAADEQLVPEQVAQPRYRVADRRLRHAQMLRHVGQLPPPHALGQDEKQHEVEPAQLGRRALGGRHVARSSIAALISDMMRTR